MNVRGVELETDRLTLRPPAPQDVSAMMEIHQHPEVLRFLAPGASPSDAVVAWRNVAIMIGHWHIRGYGPWVVIDRDRGEILGRVGLWNPEGWPGIELGWALRRSRWGHGFATEAARAVLSWAWRSLDVSHIISMIALDNERSLRVATKLQMRLEGTETKNGVAVATFGIVRPEASDAPEALVYPVPQST